MHTAPTLAEVSERTTRYLADVSVTFPAVREMAQRVCDLATNRGLYASDFRVPDGMYSMAFDLGNSKEGSGRTASVEVHHSAFSVTRRFDSADALQHAKHGGEDSMKGEAPSSFPLALISCQETFCYTRDVDSPADTAHRGRGQWRRLGGEVLKNLVGTEDAIIDNVLRDVRAFLDGERGL